jgi:hypothetical protein
MIYRAPCAIVLMRADTLRGGPTCRATVPLLRILGRFNSEKAAEEEKKAERTKRELQERSAQAQQAAADRR